MVAAAAGVVVGPSAAAGQEAVADAEAAMPFFFCSSFRVWFGVCIFVRDRFYS
jgi:hypothetical protein